jgi:HK97 family phage major capsid protein
MKKIFSGLFFYDPAVETKGGGTDILVKEIKDLGENYTKGITEVKAEVKTVKDSIATEVKGAKDELQEEISKAKGEAQKASVKVDELEKKMNTAGHFSGGNVKSLNEVIKTELEAKTDDIAKFAKKETNRLTLEIKGFDVKAVADVSTANVTGGSVWGAQYKPGIIMNPSTLTHVRSLLSVQPAGEGTDYYFMKENGNGEGAPANTAEKKAAAATNVGTGLLPSFDIDLIESSVKFETIGGVMPISRKAMKNVPGLIAFLQKRVPEKLLDVEDAQILYGDGTSPNIKGILTAGNFTAGSGIGATVLAEKIINDLSTFEDTYKRKANGIVVRPADYYSFFKQKASGSGEYDLPQGFVFVNGVLYILGIPVATTTALTANDYTLGDWNLGADLLQQDSITMEFFEQDGNNVKTLQTTLRVLETVALPVYGSDYFMKGSSSLA